MNRPLNANTDANPEQPIEPQLAALLDTLLMVPPRDPQAASHGRAAFLAEAAQRKSSVASAGGARSRWFLGAQSAFAAVLRPAWALVIVLATIAFGGATVVFAAQGSLPDEPLYPVKVWSEDAQLSLANNSDARLNLLIEFTQRRKAELDALQARQMQPSPRFYERFGDQVDAALSLSGADAILQDDDRAELESLRDQINPIVPTASPLPQPTASPSPSATPLPSATATATPPPADTPVPIVAPSDTPAIVEASATSVPLPTRARRDDIRATLTALPLPQPPPEPRPDVRATRDASPRPEPPPMPDVLATLDALPTQEPPPQPDIKATRDAIEDAIRPTLDALPTPEPPPPPPSPPQNPPQPPARPERPEGPEPPERRPRP
jgi:hypothetical protein